MVMDSDHFVAEQENTISSPNQAESDNPRSHTTTQHACGGADQIQITLEDGSPQENSDGTAVDLEMEVLNFRPTGSDVVEHKSVDHESILDASLMLPELTRDSPPSYESVVKSSTAVVQASTTSGSPGDTCSDTVIDDVITTQPQSGIVGSPMVDVDSTNSNHRDVSDSDAEQTATIDYLRRRRRERGNIDDSECCDNLELCCCACFICVPSGHTSHDIDVRANCTGDCFEVSHSGK